MKARLKQIQRQGWIDMLQKGNTDLEGLIICMSRYLSLHQKGSDFTAVSELELDSPAQNQKLVVEQS